MIVGFDLDDTLYRELDFVESGFRAVSDWLAVEHAIPADASLSVMTDSLASNGRGRQFDDVLRAFDLFTIGRRNRLIQVYRNHSPTLSLPSESVEVLTALRSEGHTLYLVTDGHAGVQARKVASLDVGRFFSHCYLTSRYGRDAAKPSTRCFELMLARSRADPDDLVYVGDNPEKDFVGVRSLGGTTIRVLTGSHRDRTAAPGFDADRTVDCLADVVPIIREIDSSE